jgi:hypothetical protein
MFRPQDVLVLLKIVVSAEGWRQMDIASALDLSQAEVHLSLKRSDQARLYQAEDRRVLRQNLLEFLIHGLKYVLPPNLGASSRGVPTAWSMRPLADEIISGSDDAIVWPHAEGSARGTALKPLYETAPAAALRDERLHQMLALVDALRVGRARERTIAERELAKRLK